MGSWWGWCRCYADESHSCTQYHVLSHWIFCCFSELYPVVWSPHYSWSTGIAYTIVCLNGQAMCHWLTTGVVNIQGAVDLLRGIMLVSKNENQECIQGWECQESCKSGGDSLSKSVTVSSGLAGRVPSWKRAKPQKTIYVQEFIPACIVELGWKRLGRDPEICSCAAADVFDSVCTIKHDK